MKNSVTTITLISFALTPVVLLGEAVAGATTKEQAPTPIVCKEALAISPIGRARRTQFPVDHARAGLLASDTKQPVAGGKFAMADGTTRDWQRVTAAEDGKLRDDALRDAYVSWTVDVAEPTVMVLEAVGHSMVYVNREPRAGDPYKTGYVRLPVSLHAGRNEFIFRCVRGDLSARLVPVEGPVQFNLGDPTLPDVLAGDTRALHGGVILLNTTAAPLTGLTLEARLAGGEKTTTKLPALLPCSIRKMPFNFKPVAVTEPAELELSLTVAGKTPDGRDITKNASLKVRSRTPDQVHKRTFVSNIDGSVQYYAVNPAKSHAKHGRPPALVLSLHGASVEALGQAQSYYGKSWAHIVAPTNRRPFGFDWEDWGRLDAIDVLELAQRELRTDSARTYLTGHSMGGHGTWHLGATFPDRFAAIGPSAGWISFWSYAGAERAEGDSGASDILRRCGSPSDTLALKQNFAQQAVYVLHGDADDNVPVDQARKMKDELSAFHRDFDYHEQPGAGHWWDASDEPGADCVDWEPMFRMFSRRVIPDTRQVRSIDFTTANPEVSCRSHWATIEAQQKFLAPSRVQLRYDPGKQRVVGTTDNVARLVLDTGTFSAAPSMTIELDGGKLEGVALKAGAGKLVLGRPVDGAWRVIPPAPKSQKGPHRCGPFKQAFNHRAVLVYGTKGSDEENAWAFAKARYDAETFWYRGNGSLDVIPDHAFDATADVDRNVVLYGNADTNAAWTLLLAGSSVIVRSGRVEAGTRTLLGDDLACLFLQPRRKSDVASVGVVSGTGVAGMRLTDRLPYFVSGVAYPDFTSFRTSNGGGGGNEVLLVGFFGPDWGVETGQFDSPAADD